jgi:aspartyl protease family protein
LPDTAPHQPTSPEGQTVRRRFLWIMLAILAVVMFFLVMQRDGSLASLETVDISSLTVKIVGLVFVLALAITFFRERLSQAIEAALVWVVIALLLVLGYTYRFELRDVADRVLSELVPGHASTRGRVVEIARGSGGNFSVVTQINGARIAMVLDTGASSVVLTQEAAKAAGLPLEVLAYTVNVDTANGRARAAPITLDQLAIGGIVERAVPALIAQPGQLRSNLLGMSFLNRLESWEVRGDRLIMRSYP